MEKQALDKLRTQVFGLYLGQRIFLTKSCFQSYVTMSHHQSDEIEHVLLRSIDSLTDEEIKTMAVLLYPHMDPNGVVDKETSIKYYLGKIPIDGTEDTIPVICGTYDYLRSIGIALPYLGHSVEELVQLGVVKLK